MFSSYMKSDFFKIIYIDMLICKSCLLSLMRTRQFSAVKIFRTDHRYHFGIQVGS